MSASLSTEFAEYMADLSLHDLIAKVDDAYTRLEPQKVFPVTCADPREIAGGRFTLQLIGGLDSLAVTAMTFGENTSPGSFSGQNPSEVVGGLTDGMVDSFFQRTHIRVLPTVHSDEHTEGAGASRIALGSDTERLGCWWVSNVEEIGHIVNDRGPELIQAIGDVGIEVPEDLRSGERLGRLTAARVRIGEFVGGGRGYAEQRLAGNAQSFVLRGDHQEQAAIVNAGRLSTLDTSQEHRVFNHDSWMVGDAVRGLKGVAASDPAEATFMSTLEFVATGTGVNNGEIPPLVSRRAEGY